MRFINIVRVLVMLGLFTSSCKVLFWRDAEQSAGGAWLNDGSFVEAMLEYESKMPLNPLSGNTLSKNYETTMYIHTFGNDGIKTEKITTFEGWVINDAIFISKDLVIMQRGLGDDYAAEKKDVFAVDLKSKKSFVLVSPTDYLLAAVPSPDGATLAVLTTNSTMENRLGKVTLEIFALQEKPVQQSRTVLEYGKAPGLPEHGWAKDSTKFFLRLNSLVEVSNSGQVKKADSFPTCILPTNSGGISTKGRRFFRTQENGIETEIIQGHIPFAQIPYTGDESRIGSTCS